MSFSTKTYDVFISFRGVDTRQNFTSHLHSALSQASIKTYIDNNLKIGDEVWPALSQAIQDSHIAIVVFSQNYACSKWCLEELTKILQCKKDERHRQVVIPVFYEVDPSTIRWQKGSYEEALSKHERVARDNGDNETIQKKVPEWKAALTEAANMSGWDSRIYKNDSQVIKKIIDDVSQKLFLRYPPEIKVKGLVGIHKICKDIQFLLSKNKHDQSSENVKVIGIWGMGGIGKTTTARAVFSQLFPLYDSVCFLQNVRELSKNDRPSKLKALSNTLLSELLKEENPKFNPSESTFIARRLSSKKVFIVLDDVDSLNQLEVLCKACEFAASGSILMITTRDRNLLAGRVDEDDIYKVGLRSLKESLELFCLHAFKQRSPLEGYENLSKTAVDYAGGVPLALKVLGSNLYSRSTEFWDSELEKVKNYPYTAVENVLRVSYDGLHPLEREIFLDIAFFFKDQNKDFVKRILNACGFSATSGIAVLEDKALITIPYNEKIQMHDLLQKMGLNLACQDIKDSGKCSRLRDIEKVYDVLQNKKGSDAVEGMSLDLSHIDDLLRLSADAFDMMTKLRFLKLFIPSDKISGKVDYPRVLNKISDNLRYLEWHGYRLKYLPSTFCAKLLVEIRMPHSHLIELWQGMQDVVNLEGIDLSECKNLKNLPDLSKASKLKWVNLTGCESLFALHPSLLCLDTLETLILDDCKKLTNLKCNKHLRSLENFSINGCTSLREFSMSSDLIKMLDLSKTGIQILHSSIGNFTSLWSLNLEGLRLRNLPSELSSLEFLTDLRISNCRVALDKQKLHVLFEGLIHLQTLFMKNCQLCELPDNISSLSQLYVLRLDGSSLEQLPESIKNLRCLVILSLNNCWNLRCLPALPLYIKEFNAANCRLLVTLSTLNTFAGSMRGSVKYISFESCMKLKGRSLHLVTEATMLTMMSAIFHNRYVRYIEMETNSINYNLVTVCLPGSSVPRQFTYRTTDSSLTITLPTIDKLLGIIFCAVLSPSQELKHGAKIRCQCYLPDGTKVGDATSWYHKAIMELNSDNVYIWNYTISFLIYSEELQFNFEFYVTNDEEEPEVLNIRTKECGVHLVYDTEDLQRTLQAMYRELEADFELELASDIKSKLGLDSESQHRETLMAIEISDETGCNDQNNQEWDSSENCSCSSYCVLDVLRYLWRSIKS